MIRTMVNSATRMGRSFSATMLEKGVSVMKLGVAERKLLLKNWLQENTTMSSEQIKRAFKERTIYVASKDRVEWSGLARCILCPGDTVMLYDDYVKKKDEAKNGDGIGLLSSAEYWARKFKDMILFENEKVICINKAADYNSQGGTGVGKGTGIDSMAISYMMSTKQMMENRTAKLVHRLDRAATGIMIIAKNTSVAERISEALRNRTGEIVRKYIALLYQEDKQKSNMQNGEMEYEVRSDLDCQKFEVIDLPPSQDKVKTLDWTMKSLFTLMRSLAPSQLACCKDSNVLNKVGKEAEGKGMLELCEVRLLTGKKHQIRKHAALCLGAPVVGDTRYGWQQSFYPKCPLFLHARSLEFSGALEEFLGLTKLVAPPPAHFESLLRL